MQAKEKFNIFATINLPISVEIEAFSEEEAIVMASNKLNEESFMNAVLSIININGEIISPKVHDLEIDINSYYE